jgi:TetR/AcrR family transcriptional regulator, repressor for uid operon
MPRTVNTHLQGERRRQILEAAHACFVRRGFHAASMAEICAEARLSAGAVYRYFPSKEEIVLAIGEGELSRAQAFFVELDAAEDLIGMMSSFVEETIRRHATPSEGAMMIELMAEATRNPAFGTRLRNMISAAMTGLERVLHKGIERGQIDPSLDPADAARLLVAAVDGLAIHAAMNPNVSGEARILRDVAILKNLLRNWLPPRLPVAELARSVPA